MSLFIFCACTNPVPSGTDGPMGGDGSGLPTDLAMSAGDGAAPGGCSGLGECECHNNPQCQSIGEVCYCPLPQCAPGDCICSGGKYLGCASKASACQATVSCRPAGRIGGPDTSGCYHCQYQSDCEKAFQQMMETLKAAPGCGISDALVSAFSCKKNPACVTKCVNDVVTRCDDIGCGLCAACRCARIGPFEQCFHKCNMD